MVRGFRYYSLMGVRDLQEDCSRQDVLQYDASVIAMCACGRLWGFTRVYTWDGVIPPFAIDVLVFGFSYSMADRSLNYFSSCS